jgi:hypothetical protein
MRCRRLRANVAIVVGVGKMDAVAGQAEQDALDGAQDSNSRRVG